MAARIVNISLGHLWWMYAVHWAVSGHPWWAAGCGALGAMMIYHGEW